MRIAFLWNARGLPANYGGFETAVQEITSRLVAEGIECEVFCRDNAYAQKLDTYGGRKLVYVSGSRNRSLDTVVSSIQVGWHLLTHRKRYDYVFWFNNANLPGILLTLLSGIPMSVNTDGLEWRRPKWSLPFKLYFFLASAVVAKLCNLISDSRELAIYYRRKFGASSVFIPYGVPKLPQVTRSRTAQILAEYGVQPGKYSLQITRIEPDNLPVEAAAGFLRSELAQKGYKHLVIGYKHQTAYSQKLKTLESEDPEHLLVRGAVYDPEVVTVLRRHCALYVHGNSVGGTNPALLEAMQLCPRVLAIDTPFSHELLGDLGEFFTVDSLALDFRRAIASPDRSEALSRRVEDLYDWDAVADAYLALANSGALAPGEAFVRKQPEGVESI